MMATVGEEAPTAILAVIEPARSEENSLIVCFPPREQLISAMNFAEDLTSG